jgi:hypothetical protein
MEKDPSTWSAITWVMVIALAVLGGIVNFHRKVAQGIARRWNFAELLGELATSAFAGLLTALLCQYSQLSLTLTAALCGIAGHMGGRAIFHLEHFFEARFPSGGSGPQKPLL